jgi:hypothetical protein
MKLRARIHTEGLTSHAIATLQDDQAVATRKLPNPSLLEIVPDANAFLLLRFDSAGNCVGDTWHETVDLAKNQALYEFGVVDAEWERTDL